MAKNATLQGGWLPHGGFRVPGPTDPAQDYGSQMREIVIVAMGWSHNGTDKDLESTVTCFGYTDAQSGSKGIKEVFSAAPLPSLSWAVAGLALFMAL